MKFATTDAREFYIYVKDNVIFKISSLDNGDACAVKVNSGNTPSFKVTPKGKTEKTYYLGELIELGDTYTDGTFKKSIHSTDKSADVDKTFTDFYYDECLEIVKDKLVEKYYVEYCKLDKKNLGVPSYMIEQNGDTTKGVSQINLSEENYNQWKKDKVAELALDAAEQAAKNYGYEVTTEKLDVKKEGEKDTDDEGGNTDDEGGNTDDEGGNNG